MPRVIVDITTVAGRYVTGPGADDRRAARVVSNEYLDLVKAAVGMARNHCEGPHSWQRASARVAGSALTKLARPRPASLLEQVASGCCTW